MGNENNVISQKLSDKMRNMAMFCAFLVVVIHCRPHFESGTVAWWVRQFTEEGITRIAVPYFFTASGFVAAAKFAAYGYGAFVRKRLRTLLLPFAIWTVLFWLFVFTINCLYARCVPTRMLAEIYTPLRFMKVLGFWPLGFPFLTPLWYVRALFFLTLVFPVLRVCVRKFGLAWLVAMFVLYGVRLVALPIARWGMIKAFFGFGLLPVEGLVYYSFGIWLCDNQKFLGRGNLFFNIASLILGLTLAGIKVPFLTSDYGFISGAIKFLMIPFMLFGIWGFVPERRLPSWFVSCSFAIYLIHKFILHVLKHVWSAGDGLPQYFAMAAVAFAVALGFAVAMHRWMPKTAAVLFGGR